MVAMNGSFNAQAHEPNQGGGVHPPAQKILFTVTSTAIKENSKKNGGYFEVELTSSMGSIRNIYNIWNESAKAVDIAHGQLSALCRAVGRFQIDWGNEGAALKGAQGLMDVGYQKGEEPDPAFPDRKGYTELKKVYDMAGNEPGKSGQQQAQPQQQTGFQQSQPQGQPNQPQSQPQSQPMTQQPGGGWGQGGGQPNPSQQPPQGQQGAQPQGQAWQPGGAPAGGSPPWGNR